MVALRNRAGHYIFGFFFVLFLSSMFFSSPNLSGRRLDVCHTSTHGVALVQIYDAGLKRAAGGSLKYRTQKLPKIRHLGTIAHLCNYGTYQIDNWKKNLLSSNISFTSPRYGELWLRSIR